MQSFREVNSNTTERPSLLLYPEGFSFIQSRIVFSRHQFDILYLQPANDVPDLCEALSGLFMIVDDMGEAPG